MEFWCDPDPADQLLPGWLGEAVPRSSEPRGGMDAIVWDVREPQSTEAADALASSGARVLALDELGPARRRVTHVVDALMTPARARRYEESPAVAYHYGLEFLILDAAALTPTTRGDEASPVIVFGGSDPEDLGAGFLRALGSRGFRGPFTLIAGLHNPSLPFLREAGAAMRGTVLEYATDLPARLRDASFVVTKLGGIVFEAFTGGAPCLLVEPTPAHEQLAAELRDHYPDWPAWNFGLADARSMDAAAAQFIALTRDPAAWRARAAHASGFVPRDGARRIVDLLLS